MPNEAIMHSPAEHASKAKQSKAKLNKTFLKGEVISHGKHDKTARLKPK